ncbi:hypothetical protein [Paraburkholderia elongata]|uniref:Uncharacterized protein n=1 Tax=Paraburkholderia elongata TaxID=2675747 RepID=A0A972NW49_9BURK|nr:hypothetical protein [Paraburkholderia elongata]NPT59709.1 hypothetical protein [Paraburkholderia elongata]
MTTDQIQTKLFEKADADTKAAVATMLKPLTEWVSTNGYGEKVKIQIQECSLFAQDSVPIRLSSEDGTTLRQKLERGHVKVSMSTIFEALREAMFNKLQGPARIKFVDDFISDVQRLKDDVEDLQSRVE